MPAPAVSRTCEKLGYFADGHARIDGGDPVCIRELKSGLRGVVVVRADPASARPACCARSQRKLSPGQPSCARNCAEGVDVAISRIIHDVQEAGFVRSLVHTRALMVIVDGLNEVSADTREKVGAFARDMSKGDVIVGFQPIEWRPPPNSYRRRPAATEPRRGHEIPTLPSGQVVPDSAVSWTGLRGRGCPRSCADALDEAPSDDERQTAELMLSNPFDLAFAAELLAQGRSRRPRR